MPVKFISRWPGPIRANRLAIAMATTLAATLPASAARESFSFASPFEVSDSPSGNYLSALIAGADHDTTAAATYFREALRFDPKNPQLVQRAFVAALANGNMLDAYTLADRVLANEPNDGLARLALGVKGIKAHQYAWARAQFAKGGPGEQRDITATLLTAWTYAGGNDLKDALAACDRLTDDNFVVFRNFHAGLIAAMLGNNAEAGKRLKTAYDADKATLRLVDAYGRFLSRTGDFAGAKKVYTDFDAFLPNQPIVKAAIAQLDAKKPLDLLVKTPEQGAAEVLYGLGAAGSRQGDETAAIVYLRLSLALAPRSPLALITLADIYDRLKQHEDAISLYESVPDGVLRTTADLQIAQLLDTIGKKDESGKLLEQIVKAHPDDEDALQVLGNEQRSAKKYGDAAISYTKAIEASKKPQKDLWPLYYFRGISYERDKQWDKAVVDFKKALDLSPDQPLVLNYLGYSWVDRGENLDEAFKMLHKAVDARPSDGYIVDSLGWGYFKLGKYDEAVKELERAIDLNPGDPTINEHLGDAYWRIGRKLDAHFQWNHARDLGPDADEKPKILEKIEHGLPPIPTPEAADAKEKTAPPSDATPKKDGG